MSSKRDVLASLGLILLHFPFAVQAGLWTVDIDESPAPSPQDGPPFSAHASRDRSLLPGQICAIIGAYVASVVFTGSILLTLGKRMRKQALAIHQGPALEMNEPVTVFGASPVSPGGSQTSWYSPRRLKKRLSSSGSMGRAVEPASPGLDSNASFDHSILEADRTARERELEFLYAAALEQEDEVSQSAIPVQFGASHDFGARTRQSRRPPRLLTNAQPGTHVHLPSPTSPQSTRSPIRAIYPPISPYDFTSSPLAPMRADCAATPLTLRYPPSPDIDSSSKIHNDRIFQSSSLGSHTSGQRGRRLLRGLRISTPRTISPSEYSDREALTPRTPYHQARSEAPTTPATFKSSLYDDLSSPLDPIDRIRDIPHPAPQRRDGNNYYAASASPPQRAPQTSSSSTLGALPFRALTSQHTHNHPANSNAPVASPKLDTRITYLERPHPRLNALDGGARTGGLRTGGLRTGGLRTGVPTPYSPYMPFTPVTPVTPRLVGRAERRAREREGARRAPVAEEDGVVEEEEIWGV